MRNSFTESRSTPTQGPSQAPKVIIFDLDDTLAESKAPLEPVMIEKLSQLLDKLPVCIISGARFEQFETQVLRFFAYSGASVHLNRLHIMPTCGTRYYRYQADTWQCLYAEDLSDAQKRSIISVLDEGAKLLGLATEHPWGDVIEDRHSQITFSALGQRAPVREKAQWDPDGRKKEALRSFAAPRLPGLEVRSGGATSIDVTLSGIDKAHGVTKLKEALGIPFTEMLFIGDRLSEGGNDYPVKILGVPTIETSGPSMTATLIDEILAQL